MLEWISGEVSLLEWRGHRLWCSQSILQCSHSSSAWRHHSAARRTEQSCQSRLALPCLACVVSTQNVCQSCPDSFAQRSSSWFWQMVWCCGESPSDTNTITSRPDSNATCACARLAYSFANLISAKNLTWYLSWLIAQRCPSHQRNAANFLFISY